MTQHLTAPFDIAAVRADFPALSREINGHPLAYLDSAASAQKPSAVLEAMDQLYRRSYANIHRGVYTLSEEATAAYEDARRVVARFIGATSLREVIFTSGTTMSINLVAQTWGRANLRPGDRVVLTMLEHHANIVPWQIIAAQTGAELAFVPLDGQGRLDLDAFDALLDERTRLVAVAHVSNVLGTINPVAEIVRRAHAVGALVLVDAAQSVPHMPVSVRELGADFLAFSSHKLCGPTGIGVLWGRRALLEAMPPFLGGGDMISKVSIEGSTWNELPMKFEAGTPPIAEAVGLAAAITYLQSIGMAAIHEREQQLAVALLDRLAEVPGVRIFGPPAEERAALAAFTLEGVHPHDVAALLDGHGIAVRAGHHCAQPLHTILDLPATSRASCYLYTTEEELDRLAAGLIEARRVFA